MAKTRVKYDLLPPGAHTILPVDSPSGKFDPGLGFNEVENWERINLNDVAEVADLNDPKSHRAYQVRGHLYGFGTPGEHGYQGPLCTLIEGSDAVQRAAITEAPKEAKAAKGTSPKA